MSHYRLAALDLDGTLVDSAPDLAQCLGHALDSVGLEPPSLADARGWIGDGVEMLVRRALSAQLESSPTADLVASVLAAFNDCYRDHLFDLSELYPDVAETLGVLAGAGLKLGCVTNKPAEFAVDLLNRAGIGSRFDFVFGGDSFERRKPDPEPLNQAARRFGVTASQSVMVGDSVNDVEAARAAGFGFVLAAYGYIDARSPAFTREIKTIRRFSDLKELLCGH